MRVVDVMTREPKCCVRFTSVRMAARLMKKFDVGLLPVVDEHATHKIIGIITDRDLCILALPDIEEANDILVEQCMTRDPICCSPEMDVRHALALMASHRIRRIPVVDQDYKLTGVVSIDDFIVRDALPAKDLFMAMKRISAPVVKEKEKVGARAARAGV